MGSDPKSEMMKRIYLYWSTVRHLKLIQMVAQVKTRVFKPSYRILHCDQNLSKTVFEPWPIKMSSYINGSFNFLNITSPFVSWNDTSHGMLWAYNLNYMDWLNQEGIGFDEGAIWIDRFIEDIPSNRVGMDPYPTALRTVNWIKFIWRHYDKISPDLMTRWNDSLYSQCMLLNKKLECHLLGNHLLEDAYALFIASMYFADSKLYGKVSKILKEQLEEQVLPDGAHFEQSPMYHCILLDRLLDCCNFAFNNIRHDGQESVNEFLREIASRMLGHLEAILYSDKTYPLFNDSARSIAPEPKDIFAYAERLGLSWHKIPMKEVGYRYLKNEQMEAFIDVGNVTSSYQPGHTHADTFTYELRVKGHPFVVDTGVSTYEKNARRHYERGTSSHNTVTVNGMDSTEVWSGFRVGKRAEVKLVNDTAELVEASHDGYGKSVVHSRKFEITEDEFIIADAISSTSRAVNYVHFAPEIKVLELKDNKIITDVAAVYVDGASQIEVSDDFVSEEYNDLHVAKTLMVHFVGSMSYRIKSL